MYIYIFLHLFLLLLNSADVVCERFDQVKSSPEHSTNICSYYMETYIRECNDEE